MPKVIPAHQLCHTLRYYSNKINAVIDVKRILNFQRLRRYFYFIGCEQSPFRMNVEVFTFGQVRMKISYCASVRWHRTKRFFFWSFVELISAIFSLSPVNSTRLRSLTKRRRISGRVPDGLFAGQTRRDSSAGLFLKISRSVSAFLPFCRARHTISRPSNASCPLFRFVH